MRKLIVIGIVAILIALMYLYPHEMLNPGELEEGHQKLSDKCLACHNPFWGISTDKCISCHKLSDIGIDKLKFNDTNAIIKKVVFHQHLSNIKCTSCHTDHKGLKPEMSLTRFNHEMLPVEMINNCNNCHRQLADNLHKQLTTACNNCHNTKGWKYSVTFNHEMIQGDAKNNCTSCHKKPEDTFHQQVKFNCDKCHSTSEWKPSTFDHSSYFLLDRNHNAKCNTCHTDNNYAVFTCYGCHEHSQSKIMEEHNEHGIYNYTNCTSCHKSGNEHDIRMDQNSNHELNKNEMNNGKKYIKSEDTNKKNERKDKKEHDND